MDDTDFGFAHLEYRSSRSDGRCFATPRRALLRQLASGSRPTSSTVCRHRRPPVTPPSRRHIAPPSPPRGCRLPVSPYQGHHQLDCSPACAWPAQKPHPLSSTALALAGTGRLHQAYDCLCADTNHRTTSLALLHTSSTQHHEAVSSKTAYSRGWSINELRCISTCRNQHIV
ncbi:hypothetical protein P153DRAFT_38396 [Dothidotthia symphoricarpi CBS 119687]|uniref:Uncharacterized protein n=1 Tax=Dothidotthia symphoricarpi CBS 119687 TaxID=1392245 RepID=A0A6A6AC75_9PLEO|nr:uncharacterized protein P153DRAFT_38396 [Dothidotthia symphoricarpi CBS 119687]KAF2128467.1 hypothetical protein P153DRAFT_38396 [Dothidotthia symphoricarpi CBS 119687]